jgi:hypothetical protein
MVGGSGVHRGEVFHDEAEMLAINAGCVASLDL